MSAFSPERRVLREAPSQPSASSHAQTTYSDEDIDETPWEPSSDFPELVVRVNDNHDVIVSGPSDQVAAVKKKFIEILSKYRRVSLPTDIERVEFKQ